MKKLIAIILTLAGFAHGYFEQSDGVPAVFSSDGSQQWRLWAGNDAAESLFDDSSGILFDDSGESVIIGKFTPGTTQLFITAMGYNAGKDNTANDQSVFGNYAGFSNSGSTQTAMGTYSGYLNSGTLQSVFGANAGRFNTGGQQAAFGYNAGYNNINDNQSAYGYYAGYFNTGIFVTDLGAFAGEFNNGDGLLACGESAAIRNDGDNNTALGFNSFNVFTLDTGSAQDITSVDPPNNRITISGGHGFGANGTYKNLKATTTGVFPSGLSAGPDIWQVISSTILECHTDSFIDTGSGTHTLTPQFVYTNSTALGYNAEPDASNQVMLGDTNVTEVKTAGAMTLGGGITLGGNIIIPDDGFIGSVSDTDAMQIKADGEVVLTGGLTIDNASSADAVITMDGTSNSPGTITYESDNVSFNIGAQSFFVTGSDSTLAMKPSQNALGDIPAGTSISAGGTNKNLSFFSDGLRTVGAKVGAYARSGAEIRSIWEFVNETADEVTLALTKNGGFVTIGGDLAVDTDVFKVDATTDIVSVNGTTTLGDVGATNYTQFSATGDMIFHGTAGLAFGGCYGNHFAWTQANAVQNQWYAIDHEAMVDGQLNNVTHDGRGKLTCTNAGVYYVSFEVTWEVAGANIHTEFGVEVDGTVHMSSMIHTESKFGAVQGQNACTSLLAVGAGETVQVAVRTVDDTALADYEVDVVNLNIIQVGG